MADYSRQIAKATRAVTRFGQYVTYYSYESVASSDQPWRADVDRPRRYPNIWMAFPLSGQQTQFLSGSVITKGGYTGIMGVQEFKPIIKDRIDRSGETVTIKDINEIKINEQTIFYIMSLDR